MLFFGRDNIRQKLSSFDRSIDVPICRPASLLAVVAADTLLSTSSSGLLAVSARAHSALSHSTSTLVTFRALSSRAAAASPLLLLLLLPLLPLLPPQVLEFARELSVLLICSMLCTMSFTLFAPATATALSYEGSVV